MPFQVLSSLASPLVYAELRGERVPEHISAEATANPYLLETHRKTEAVNRLQIATLMGSLSRSVELLTVNIEQEESRAGFHDQSDPAYPVLARPQDAKGQYRGDHRRVGGAS